MYFTDTLSPLASVVLLRAARLTHVCLRYRKCGSSVYDAAALVVDPGDSCVRKFAFPPLLVMTQGCIVSVTLPLPPGTITHSVPRVTVVVFNSVCVAVPSMVNVGARASGHTCAVISKK